MVGEVEGEWGPLLGEEGGDEGFDVSMCCQALHF